MFPQAYAESPKKNLVVGLGNFAPYYIEEGERWIFTDIGKEIFKQLPHYSATYKFMSNEKLATDFQDSTIDIATNLRGVEVKHTSIPIFKFNDQVVALKKNKYSINKISDLSNKSIITYQRAKFKFGDEFKEMAEKNPNYTETPIQNNISKMLMGERANISVGDINIFLHNIKKEHPDVDVRMFEFFDILPKGNPSTASFTDGTLKEEFDKAAKMIIENGTYQKIYDRYLAELQNGPK